MIDVLTERVLESVGAWSTSARSRTRPSWTRTSSWPPTGSAAACGPRRPQTFRPTVTTGRNQYAWLGTPKVFDAFTFAFERTEAGWVWAYGYPSSGATSTFIVECAPSTWERLGLGSDAGLQIAADIFPTSCPASRCWARRRGCGSRRCAT